MRAQDRHTETKVGLFVLLGLSCIAVMVVYFGRLGEGFKQYYPLTVEFPNASGLLKGSDVYVGGAKVGIVTDKPRIVDISRGVLVDLKIYSGFKIPEGSVFRVGSSGLLGDRFVSITPPSEMTGSFIEPGTVIAGKTESGFDDLTKQGVVPVEDLRTTVKQIQTTLTHLDEGLLSPSNWEDLKVTLANLKTTSENFVDLSEKLTLTIDKAGGTFGKADETLASIKLAADDARGGIEDLRKGIAGAREVVSSAKGVMDEAKVAVRKATTGGGLLATLLTDRKLSEDTTSLIENLRRDGVLFYKDRAVPMRKAEPNRSVRP